MKTSEKYSIATKLQLTCRHQTAKRLDASALLSEYPLADPPKYRRLGWGSAPHIHPRLQPLHPLHDQTHYQNCLYNFPYKKILLDLVLVVHERLEEGEKDEKCLAKEGCFCIHPRPPEQKQILLESC